MLDHVCERNHKKQGAAVRRRLGFLGTWAVALAILAVTAGLPRHADAASVTVAQQGQAKQKIVVGMNAGEKSQDTAKQLAAYLARITGGEFEVVRGDGRTGIAVGTPADFPDLKLEDKLTATGIVGREQYLIQSHDNGIWLVGKTETAADYAMWDLLHRVGHRQFFPGEKWEYIPSQQNLALDVDTVQTPDYLYRRIWYGYGLWDYNREPYEKWLRVNRAPGVFTLHTGHAYGQVIRQFKAQFDANPQYYALVNGERNEKTGHKMCTANPGVQKIVVEYARNYFEKNPDSDCVSIDPTDGGGWCECEECAKIGTPSDRALLLANLISEYLEQNLPDKYVALYAYNQHSPPPNIQARERVIINVATSFLRGGYSATELMDAWHKKGVQRIGVREYYSVSTWDRDLPGRARGSNLNYLTRTIPQFHALGAVFMTSEASDNWGSNGLGYYLATRMFWDVDEVSNIEALKEDFFTKAFGQAAPAMKQYYNTIDGSTPTLLAPPLIGKMYSLLQTAATQTTDTAILARIDDLILYTRYVELYYNYTMAAGAERQTAYENVIRHAYQMRKTMMVHTKALYRDNRDKAITIPDDAKWNVAEDRNPWKSSEPFTREQLDGFVEQGIAANPLLDFEPVAFEGTLVPAAARLGFKAGEVLPADYRSRGNHTYYFHIDKPGRMDFTATGGLIAGYRDRGPAELRLYKDLIDIATLTDQFDVPNTGETSNVSLKLPEAGTYLLTISDGGDMSRIDWPKSISPTIEASVTDTKNFTGRVSVYFYVPKGTKTVGGHLTASRGSIFDANGREAFKISQPGYFSVPVPPGQDGKLWSFRNIQGRLILMTVPPFVCADPAQIMLPEDIVKKDSSRN